MRSLPVKTAQVNMIRAIVFVTITVGALLASLTVSTDPAYAGFTPTPAPVATRVPPTATPAPPGGGGGGGGGGAPSEPSESAAAPPSATPLPKTGEAGWLLALILLLWLGSIPLILPMIGPLRRRRVPVDSCTATQQEQQ
jgi:hypothetical protein